MNYFVKVLTYDLRAGMLVLAADYRNNNSLFFDFSAAIDYVAVFVSLEK